MPEAERLRPYDFEDDGVRQCPARERRKTGALGQCRTVVLCPAVFCRVHWRKLPHYLQDGIVRAMIARDLELKDKLVKVELLVKDGVAFLLGTT